MNGPYSTIDDVANHFAVSVSTIRSWVRQGHIPKDTYIKVGNTYRFAIKDIADALKPSAQEDNDEVLQADVALHNIDEDF
jgi:excisionase family DNA binding protein